MGSTITLGPNVTFGPGVTFGAGVTILDGGRTDKVPLFRRLISFFVCVFVFHHFHSLENLLVSEVLHGMQL